MSSAEWHPRAGTLATIDAARSVLQDAEAAGYRFTLRRVFYALVSGGEIPNTGRAYKNLSAWPARAGRGCYRSAALMTWAV